MTTTPISEARRLGWPVLSVEESREIDQTAIHQFGIPGITLMENAGRACANRLLTIATTTLETVILCGGGNNGGDGMVIAIHFLDEGWPVRVCLLAPPQKLRGDAKLSYERAVAAGVNIQRMNEPSQIAKVIENCDGMIVDCLLGTGATGDPREPYASAIRYANDQSGQRIAIDIPSGLNGDTGIASTPTFEADLTLTFVTAKTGMSNPDASAFLGDIEIVDIGLPDEMMQPLRSRPEI